MKRVRKTISLTGNARRRARGHPGKVNAGFTFFEVMIAVLILAFGIVAVYRAFFISTDYVNHVDYRLYANMLLDNKMDRLQGHFDSYAEISMAGDEAQETVNINNRDMVFNYTMDVKSVEQMTGILEVDLQVSWREGDRVIKLARSAYLSKF